MLPAVLIILPLVAAPATVVPFSSLDACIAAKSALDEFAQYRGWAKVTPPFAYVCVEGFKG